MSHDKFFEKAKEWDKHPERLRVADEFAAKVEKLVTFTPQSEVLDFGCGTGAIGLRFGKRVKTLFLLDTSEAMLGLLNGKIENNDFGNVQVISVPLQEAGLSAGKMDVILTSMALHHIEDLPEIFEIMEAILKQGGQLIIGELLPEDGSFHGDEVVPHNGLSPEQLGEMLECAGFSVNGFYEHGVVNKPGKDGLLQQYEKFVLEAVKP